MNDDLHARAAYMVNKSGAMRMTIHADEAQELVRDLDTALRAAETDLATRAAVKDAVVAVCGSEEWRDVVPLEYRAMLADEIVAWLVSVAWLASVAPTSESGDD